VPGSTTTSSPPGCSSVASALPERRLVAVAVSTVYGFDTHWEREREPTDLVFRLPPSRLQVRVHRVLERRPERPADPGRG
jgi:hypothetical protein